MTYCDAALTLLLNRTNKHYQDFMQCYGNIDKGASSVHLLLDFSDMLSTLQKIETNPNPMNAH